MVKKDKKHSYIVEGLLDYLDQEHEENLISQVASELNDIADRDEKADLIEVVSPIELTESDKKKITDMVFRKFSRKLPVKVILDKSIIAGFVMKVGDFYLDSSLKRELKTLKEYLLS